MITQLLRDRTKRLEGWKLKAYKCPAGHWTIGAGWNIDAWGIPKHMREYFRLHDQSITEDMAEELLTISLDAATRQCKELFLDFDLFTENRQMALIDVVFNMGAGRIKKSFPAFVHAVERKCWQWAADELKYADGIKKGKLSLYWTQLHGDPDWTDDKKVERPEENYKLLVEG